MASNELPATLQESVAFFRFCSGFRGQQDANRQTVLPHPDVSEDQPWLQPRCAHNAA